MRYFHALLLHYGHPVFNVERRVDEPLEGVLPQELERDLLDGIEAGAHLAHSVFGVVDRCLDGGELAHHLGREGVLSVVGFLALEVLLD